MLDALPTFGIWALVFARVAPSGVMLALASRGALPSWLGLGLSLAIAAGLAAGVAPPALLTPAWPWALLRELCVGLAFASVAALPFFAIGVGVRLVERSEPSVRTPLATLYVLAALGLTVSLGGLRAYVGALSESLALVPLATPSLSRGRLFSETQAIVAQSITAALSLGLPLLTAVWLLDLTLALVLRLAHVGSKVDALPVRRLLVLLLLALSCAPWVSRMPALTRTALLDARAAVARLAR